MSIRVRFFASLRERVGRAQLDLDAGTASTVAEVWARACHQLPLDASILAAVNHDYVEVDAAVKDGDEVAFFPPVTGG